MISFNKIVNKLSKKQWKIILNSDIFEIIDPEFKEENKVLMNKTVYKLKSIWMLKTIKNWVYIIPNNDDEKLNEIDLIEKYYFKLLKRYIKEYVLNEYYISWKKSLELHLKNFSIPENIYITNRKINKKVKIWNYTIIFKRIWWKINIFNKLQKMTISKEIDNLIFKISNLELSLIETSLINENISWVELIILNQAIKKYSKFFIIQNFYYIWELKYITSINRLKELSKNINPELYKVFLDIIKKNWGLFIWEWLRKI